MREKKKEYLNSYLIMEAKINRLRKMSSINPEFKDTYSKALNDALELRLKIERQISEVDNGVLSELLYQKYIFGKSLEEVSYIINYSLRHTERLHIKALDKFKM